MSSVSWDPSPEVVAVTWQASINIHGGEESIFSPHVNRRFDFLILSCSQSGQSEHTVAAFAHCFPATLSGYSSSPGCLVLLKGGYFLLCFWYWGLLLNCKLKLFSKMLVMGPALWHSRLSLCLRCWHPIWVGCSSFVPALCFGLGKQ